MYKRQAWDELLSDIKQVQVLTRTALSSVNTTKKLVETYPELIPFCPVEKVQGLAVAPGEIAKQIACTKEDDCAKGKKAKQKAAKPPQVIKL